MKLIVLNTTKNTVEFIVDRNTRKLVQKRDRAL